MAEHFPNLARDLSLQIQRLSKPQKKINPKKFMPGYITIKTFENERKNLKAARGKTI